MNTELTEKQVNALEAMIARRMANTNETREKAAAFIAKYLAQGV